MAPSVFYSKQIVLESVGKMLVVVHAACMQERRIEANKKNISLVASATHKTSNTPELEPATQAEGIHANAVIPSATRDFSQIRQL